METLTEPATAPIRDKVLDPTLAADGFPRHILGRLGRAPGDSRAAMLGESTCRACVKCGGPNRIVSETRPVHMSQNPHVQEGDRRPPPFATPLVCPGCLAGSIIEGGRNRRADRGVRVEKVHALIDRLSAGTDRLALRRADVLTEVLISAVDGRVPPSAFEAVSSPVLIAEFERSLLACQAAEPDHVFDCGDVFLCYDSTQSVPAFNAVDWSLVDLHATGKQVAPSVADDDRPFEPVLVQAQQNRVSVDRGTGRVMSTFGGRVVLTQLRPGASTTLYYHKDGLRFRSGR